MDKTVYVGSLLIALMLILGSVLFPSSAVMWLASTSELMDIARGIMVALMLGLIFTNPPRSARFRLLLGTVSFAFGVWGLRQLFNGSVHIIDAMLLLETSVAFCLASIEAEPLLKPEDAVEETKLWHVATADKPVMARVRQLVFGLIASQVLRDHEAQAMRLLAISGNAAKNYEATKQPHAPRALALAGGPQP